MYWRCKALSRNTPPCCAGWASSRWKCACRATWRAWKGCIIPGGESTTIGKLAVEWGLMEPLRELARRKPVWGTCAGAIFLSRDAQRQQPLLGLMDITVERNAFGRQVDSFETDLDVPALSALAPPNGHAHPPAPFHAMFIRAPLIASVGPDVEVLSRLADGRIVAARQGHWLATSFHPELTNDDRFHRLFVSMVAGAQPDKASG